MPKGVTVKVRRGRGRGEGPQGHAAASRCRRASSSSWPTGSCTASPRREDKALGKFHGLARSLVANAVHGVTDGFKRELDIVGVGYRGGVKGREVHFALGYSHPIVFASRQGIDIAIEKQTHVTVTGIDRQLVGQVAANIRALRKPDPYKQKGVRYTGEVLKKKAGKTGASSARRATGRGPGARERVRCAAYGNRGREVTTSHEDRRRKTDASAFTCGSASGCGHGGAAAAGRVPQRGAHLRAGDRRPRRGARWRPPRASSRREGPVRPRAPAAATRRAPGSSASVVAERLKEKGIKRVVFDRGGFLYHGRVRAVADAAREGGPGVLRLDMHDIRDKDRRVAARPQGHGRVHQPRHQGREGRQEPELQRAGGGGRRSRPRRASAWARRRKCPRPSRRASRRPRRA